MSYYQEVKEIIDYIDDKIEENITLEDLSKVAHYSKFHLHRFFKAKTGHSLMEYIRNRKLAKSVFYLVNTDYSIDYIATVLSFNHTTNYIRAFKNKYGITPGDYRKNKPELPLTLKIQLGDLNNLGDAILFDYQTVYIPAMTLAGKKHTIYFEDNIQESAAIKAAMAFSDKYYNRLPNLVEPDIFYGLTTDIGMKSSTYFPSCKVSKVEPVDDPDISFVNLPGYTYAVFKYVGAHPLEEITFLKYRTVLFSINQWLQMSHYEQCAPFQFEKIDVKSSRADYCEVHVYIPIHP